MKKCLRIAGLSLTLALAAAIVLPGSRRQMIGMWTYGRQARDGTLKVGDPAPRVSLVALDGSTKKDLGEWLGPRPLVLIFGSFT